VTATLADLALVLAREATETEEATVLRSAGEAKMTDLEEEEMIVVEDPMIAVEEEDSAIAVEGAGLMIAEEETK
jgi:hypothetical protein